MAISEKQYADIRSNNPVGRRTFEEDLVFTKLAVGAGTPQGTQAALTAVDATAIDDTYGTVEEDVLNNVRTRLGEIETALQALGVIA